VSTKSIRTTPAHSTCDVCGRTLLRGERAEVYLSGGTRRSVCELCTSRALHGGWVREGTVPEYGESSPRAERRRSLLGRLRSRRDQAGDVDGVGADEYQPEFYDDSPEPLSADDPYAPAPDRPSPSPSPSSRYGGASAESRYPAREGREGRAGRNPGGRRTRQAPAREPRHVRAVPTSIEHKISSAVSLYNSSEHPRTVAGIARSLGLPEVSVHPADPTTSVVHVVVSWELCWYRYEVDLSDDEPTVRVSGQGYELSELEPIDLEINAAIDERGHIDL
jgi:hypothetical protein